MEKLLVRTTYRTILRSAIAIDKDPALRAVLVVAPCSFYDRVTLQWTPVDTQHEWLEARKVIDHIISSLNNGQEWYLPSLASSSSVSSNKGKSTDEKFRNETLKKAMRFQHGELVSRVRTLYRETPLSTQNLNSAFSAVKLLSYVMQFRKQLPICNYKLPPCVGVPATFPPPDTSSPQKADTTNSSDVTAIPIVEAPPFEIAKMILATQSIKVSSSERQHKTRDYGTDSVVFEAHTKEAATTAAAEGETATDVEKSIETETKATTLADVSASIAALKKLQPKESLPTSDIVGMQLLVAHPLSRGFFRHSIILVNQTGTNGATGFIINKPVINDDGLLLPVWAIVPDTIHILFTKHLKNNIVFIGGPVSSANSSSHAVFLLHRIPCVKHSVSIGNGVYLGSDFDTLNEAFEEGRAQPNDVMVILGYSGWGMTQLEGEIKSGVWVVLRRPWDPQSPATTSATSEETNGIDKDTDKSAKSLPRYQSTVVNGTTDFIFGRNVIIESSKNLPRQSALPLQLDFNDVVVDDPRGYKHHLVDKHEVVATSINTESDKESKKRISDGKKGRKRDAAMESGSEEAAPSLSPNCEPFLSWVSLFGSLSPKHKAMTRLADIRTEGAWD